MMKCILSIIIPVYDIEEYIIDCLKSVEKQIVDECEVIIVNDGSTDDSEKKIKNFICNKSSYKYLKQENRGLSEARNTGIRAARGDYLLFLDGDDLLYDNSLSYLLNKCLSDCVSEVVICRYDELDDITKKRIEGPKLSKNTHENPLEFYEKFVNKQKNWISAWSCVVKRSFLLNNNLFFMRGLLHEDELWVIQVLIHANNLYLYDYPTHIYRVNRKGSITASVSYKHIIDKLFICRELYSIRNKENSSVLNKRIASDMFSVVLSTRYIHNMSEFKKIKKIFKSCSVCLRTKEGIILYFIYKILGLDVCRNIIMLLRKG